MAPTKVSSADRSENHKFSRSAIRHLTDIFESFTIQSSLLVTDLEASLNRFRELRSRRHAGRPTSPSFRNDVKALATSLRDLIERIDRTPESTRNDLGRIVGLRSLLDLGRGLSAWTDVTSVRAIAERALCSLTAEAEPLESVLTELYGPVEKKARKPQAFYQLAFDIGAILKGHGGAVSHLRYGLLEQVLTVMFAEAEGKRIRPDDLIERDLTRYTRPISQILKDWTGEDCLAYIARLRETSHS